eukprot:CAMPEP_0185605224 /NCGR_PEP_ID=MMETSP0436-20130131/3874_1 /TAXON_ID=626734 ORGANISM="Favella taraikaensis, Strain Fe Narragansett Bay" /NCGR_SAMPLE_ID=MMETSP0436 /ASSEMBLY_ACC=CAM_ASM_000390 /LENGTH=85 /DNA_ID=CAMNT_0028236343 /DNA_START=144 /DNA_END=401 /DNA_ORIENTATION=-
MILRFKVQLVFVEVVVGVDSTDASGDHAHVHVNHGEAGGVEQADKHNLAKEPVPVGVVKLAEVARSLHALPYHVIDRLGNEQQQL